MSKILYVAFLKNNIQISFTDFSHYCGGVCLCVGEWDMLGLHLEIILNKNVNVIFTKHLKRKSIKGNAKQNSLRNNFRNKWVKIAFESLQTSDLDYCTF